MAEIEIAPDRAALAVAAARHVASVAEAALAARGRFTLALAGGSTPRAAYARLAEEPFAARVDWGRTVVFWGDERCVPPEHPDSNCRMAHEALLAHVPIPAGSVHRLRCEEAPERAAADYIGQLETVFAGRPPGATPRFDLILLGLGADGHTASLFPGSPALQERERWVVAGYVEALGAWRVSFTPPLLNAAAQVTFLVAGADKAARLREVLAGPYQPEALPAQSVRPTDGRLLWLVDADAASQLEPVRG